MTQPELTTMKPGCGCTCCSATTATMTGLNAWACDGGCGCTWTFFPPPVQTANIYSTGPTGGPITVVSSNG